MAFAVRQVADGVHRCVDGLVNFYLVEDGADLLLVDSGWPRSPSRVLTAVASLGRTPADLRAVLLTHAHPDHLGSAERLRAEHGVPVHVRQEEAGRARGEAPGSSPFAMVPGLLPRLVRPAALGFVLHAAGHGFLTPRWVKDVVPFSSGATGTADLDLPGRPRAVSTPGHTPGHTSYLLPGRGVLFSGDALVTLDVLTRRRGPRLLPDALTDDPPAARASLDRLEDLAADLLLPGHGAPWRGEPRAAVATARAALHA